MSLKIYIQEYGQLESEYVEIEEYIEIELEYSKKVYSSSPLRPILEIPKDRKFPKTKISYNFELSKFWEVNFFLKKITIFSHSIDT